MTNKLNEMFTARYSKLLADLNKTMFLSEKQDGMFMVPVPTIVGDGMNILNPPTGEAIKLNIATVKIEVVPRNALLCIYVVNLPYSELEVATKNPAYFNFIMDRMVSTAVAVFKEKVGAADVARFGTEYMSFSGFVEIDSDTIQIRFTGEWANV